MHLKILVSMFWSIILNFCCKTKFYFSFRLRERVKRWMHLKRILVSMFWSINASLPHPRLARACTSTRCSVKQVVGVLVLYYRALADLATTSDASRDALQKNQCDRRTKKQAGSLPPIQNNRTKKPRGHRLVLLRSFYQIKYRFLTVWTFNDYTMKC